jgi:hypothetical protein
MTIRVSLFGFARLAATTIALTGGLAGCGGGGGGKLVVDNPALPYQAPDIEELTGIDDDDEDADTADTDTDSTPPATTERATPGASAGSGAGSAAAVPASAPAKK